MSLRARLLIVVAVLATTYVVAAVAIVSNQRSLLIRQVDRQLMALPPNVLAGLGQPPEVVPGVGAGDVVERSDNPLSAFFIGAVGPDGDETTLATSLLLPGTPDIAAAVDATDGGRRIATIGAVDASIRFRVMVMPRTASEGWIVAAQSLGETDAAVSRLVRTLWAAGAVLAAVLAVAFLWVERLGLRPIARVTAAAEAITRGDRAHRVDVRGRGTEVGKLGRAFNVMLDERDASEGRLRQFVADASHELRTPLTSVRGYLELYRQGAFREGAQMDDVIRRLSAESTRMHGLVEDLLALASLDEGRPLRAEPVDLGELLRDAAQDAGAVQPERAITVLAPADGLVVAGDPALLVQLVGILVSNALAHTPVDAPITLTATREATWALITVVDRGPGLDPEAAGHAFDRFWRGQASRARSSQTAGAGLGLAIARSITDAHGGSITLASARGQGSTFTARLPIARSATGD